MKTYGLIGFPISHSFSEKFFSEKFRNELILDSVYKLFPLEDVSKFSELLKDKSLKGLNVTIPYKVDVLSFLNDLDPVAAEIGAVNCIHFVGENDNRKLIGYNTDAYGFEMSLKPFLTNNHKKALIFGDGGAAQAVKYVLNKLNIAYISVTRTAGGFGYNQVSGDLLESYKLLINTTPIGMYPRINEYPPIPYEFITKDHLAYDLIYNPLETTFLKKAKEEGASVKNGLEMLELQAEKSWYIWNR